jgi:hypothetical protein
MIVTFASVLMVVRLDVVLSRCEFDDTMGRLQSPTSVPDIFFELKLYRPSARSNENAHQSRLATR